MAISARGGAGPLARLRRNHAIEHATVAVLFERRGARCRVFALSDPAGFTIVGPFGAGEVASAAADGLRRLQAGESSLALTEMCGTNVVVTGLLAGLAAVAGAGRSPARNLPRALNWAVLATAAAPAAGKRVQRSFTTDANCAAVTLGEVTSARLADRPCLRVRLHHHES